MTVEETLAERGLRYGDFADHAYISQRLQDVMRAPGGWASLSYGQKQALTVIADKIARILTGDPDYGDNWHDIQGYAKLVEDRLPAQTRQYSVEDICSSFGVPAPQRNVTLVDGARIDWSKAPASARYAARDTDGSWYWYDETPTTDSTGAGYNMDTCLGPAFVENHGGARDYSLRYVERP